MEVEIVCQQKRLESLVLLFGKENKIKEVSKYIATHHPSQTLEAAQVETWTRQLCISRPSTVHHLQH